MAKRLSTTQHERLLEFIHELHACRSLHDFPQVLTTLLGKIISTDTVSYNEVYPARERTVAMLRPEVPGIMDMLDVFRAHIHEHPVINYVRATGDGSAHQIADFLSRRQFHQLALYREFYALIGVENQLSFSILPGGAGEIIVGVAFSRGSRKFSEEERRIVDLARGHVARCYLNLVELGHLQAQLDRLSQSLDALDHGILHWSHQGIVLHASAPARDLLERYLGWKDVKRLPAELDNWAHQSLAAGEAHPAPFIKEGAQGRLIARFTERTEFHFVNIVLKEERHHMDLALLQNSLGLSRREAEVLAWIAGGKSNAAIAAILGTSLYTVKAHVRSILEKLKVENRTSAAARATELLRGK